jgi:hypothetical protein
MRNMKAFSVALVGLLSLWLIAAPAGAQTEQQQQEPVKIPEPGVPQIMTMEGRFVRAAYNNEGYVILGYRVANNSVGEEWMLLEVGVTIMDRVPDYTLKRDAISLTTPDGTTVQLATQQEYGAAGSLRALNGQANNVRDSIDYFPPAREGCRIGFFADPTQRALPWDQVDLTSTRACLGRLFFIVPGGIKYGQHWLDVKFEKSLVRVPFRILTKEEYKFLDKNYKDISKQVEEAFRPKK